MLLRFFLGIGLLFGSLAALIAYLITYKEMAHHYMEKHIPRRQALGVAVFTLIFFLVLAIALAYALPLMG